MNWQTRKIAPGLHLVATPIGNARDITLRALDVLASADVLAAEDTRSLRRLLEIHGVALGDRHILAYHDHNGDKVRPKLLAALADGRSVAYASEAGTPLISDPGFDLVRAALAEGFDVTAAPGATAAVTALSISGLASDRFCFLGFLPNAGGKRRKMLAEVQDIPATLVFYESPKRLAAMLRDVGEVMGERPTVVCRELTKKFEERRAGTAAELAAAFGDAPPKGEIVVLVARGERAVPEGAALDDLLRAAMETLSVKDAAAQLARAHGLPKRDLYQRAMQLRDGD